MPWLDERARRVKQSLDEAQQLVARSGRILERSRVISAFADRAAEQLLRAIARFDELRHGGDSGPK